MSIVSGYDPCVQNANWHQANPMQSPHAFPTRNIQSQHSFPQAENQAQFISSSTPNNLPNISNNLPNPLPPQANPPQNLSNTVDPAAFLGQYLQHLVNFEISRRLNQTGGLGEARV